MFLVEALFVSHPELRKTQRFFESLYPRLLKIAVILIRGVDEGTLMDEPGLGVTRGADVETRTYSSLFELS